MKIIAVLLILAFVCVALANKNPPSDEQMRKGLRKYLNSVSHHIQNYFNNFDLSQIGWTQALNGRALELEEKIRTNIGWRVKRGVNEENKKLGKKQNDDEDEDEPVAPASQTSPAKSEETPNTQNKKEGGPHEEYEHVHPPCFAFRVTIIDPIGDVLADTFPGPIYTSNGNGYNSRPEVILAIVKGEGFSSRPIGDTFGYYLARTYFSDNHPSYHITVRVACMNSIPWHPII